MKLSSSIEECLRTASHTENTFTVSYEEEQMLLTIHTSTTHNTSNSWISPHTSLYTTLPSTLKQMMKLHRVKPGEHDLKLYFGVQQFLTLRPVFNKTKWSREKCRMILSAAFIAANQYDFGPVFVAFGQASEGNWMGRVSQCGFGVRFDVKVFADTQRKLRHLNGVEDFLRDHILREMSPQADPSLLSTSSDFISSAHFVYEIRAPNWSACLGRTVCENNALSQLDLEIDRMIEMSDNSNEENSIHGLNWGPSSYHKDIIQLLQLTVAWPDFPQGTIMDNSLYSDLKLKNAPIWSLSSVFSVSEKPGFARLTDTLSSFCTLAQRCSTVAKSIGDMIAVGESITQPIWVSGTTFTTSSVLPPRQVFHSEISSIFNFVYKHNIEAESNDTKSAPFASLLSRLVLIMQRSISIPAESIDEAIVAVLWDVFVSRLREHWEQSQSIPGIALENIDLSCCLIYQKIQILARCIELRKNSSLNDAHDDGEKKFDDMPEGVDENAAQTLPQLYLIETGKPLKIPLTQNQPQLSEDRIHEQQDLLVKLGSGDEASRIRAEMQGAIVTSDMEAFKASNPGAILADFVRWHSPNDWILCDEDTHGVKGELSVRMKNTDNLWHQLWKISKPVPIKRQKPLFDHVMEAELILDYFCTLSPACLLEQLTAIALQNTISMLKKILKKICTFKDSLMPNLQHHFDALNLMHCGGERSRYGVNPRSVLHTILPALTTLENCLSRAKMLLMRWPEKFTLIDALVSRGHIDECSSTQRKFLHTKFFEDYTEVHSDDLLHCEDIKPHIKRFTATLCAPLPYRESRNSVHRVCVTIDSNGPGCIATAIAESEI